MQFCVKECEASQLLFLASVVREPKCHFVLIFNNWNCKCNCEVSGNGNGTEYETRVAEVQRRRMKKGAEERDDDKIEKRKAVRQPYEG